MTIPTHLFVCDEETSNPAVQRVDLSLPPRIERHDDRHGSHVVRSGQAHAVGHDHRRRRGRGDGRPVRNPRSGQHQHADQRHRSRRWDDERSEPPRQAEGGREPVVRELRDQARRNDDFRRRARARRRQHRQRRRRHLQVRSDCPVHRHGSAADYAAPTVAAGVRERLRPARRGKRFVELGTGRRNRKGAMGGR